jgi:hypothetical protein
VELLVVMSACSVILTMSASLIHRAMRTQSESRAFYDAQRSALRLARQFRDDVHHATTASLNRGELGENVVLRLQFAGERTAEYGHADSEVLRNLSRRGGAISREEFAFPSPIKLDVRQEDSPPRIVLTITAERDAAAATRSKEVELHVEASFGRAPSQEELP